MKILFLQKMAGVAGSEMYFLNLLPNLVKQQVDAHFLLVQHPDNAAKNKSFIRDLEENDVAVHIINGRSSISPFVIWSIFSLIKEHKFDILQTNLIHADVWGACIKRWFMPGLKIVSTKHGYGETFQQKYGLNPLKLNKDLRYRLTKWAAASSDRIVSISQGLHDFYTGGGMVESEKALVIPYGFNFDDVVERTQSGDLRFGEQQIVIVGRLVSVKQHNLVLSIMPALVARFPFLQLVNVGAGPLEQELKRESEVLGIQQYVRWEGFQNSVHDYVRDSDIMVLPSSAEGFGLVILEAWHHSKAVVAFDVPAPNEIICHGRTGCLVKPFDTNELFEAICNLFSQPHEMQRMGEAGNEVLKAKYSLASMTAKTLGLYEQVVAE